MNNPPVITDPRSLDPLTLGPITALTSQHNIPSDGIELAENGSFNAPYEVSHAMSLTTPGMFNCESPIGFRQIPIDTYMIPGTTIYFFSFVNNNPQFMSAFVKTVNQRLGKQGYDWAQVIAEGVNIFGWKPFGWLHCPGTEDCSEEVVREIKTASDYLPDMDKELIDYLYNQSTPQDLLNFNLAHPIVMNFLGIYAI